MRHTATAALDCPIAPPEQASVYARALHRACLIVGGMERLAGHLDIEAAQLRRWMLGDEQPPERVFLAAVEVVLLHAASGGRA